MNFNNKTAILCIALSGMLYGSLGLFGTWLMQDGFSISNMLFWRFAAAAFTILPLGFKDLRGLGRSDFRIAIRGSLLYSLCSALYFMATNSIGTGLGMVIFYTYPFFIFISLWVFLKQPVSKTSWVSLGIVGLGFMLLHQNIQMGSASVNSLGIGYAILSALCYAAYILVSKKQSLHINPFVSTFVLCIGNAVVFWMISQFGGTFAWPQRPQSWMIILSLGFLATSAPILLLLYGLKRVGADLASLLSVLEPVFTVILGFFFLEETLNSTQWMGVFIILLGSMAAAHQGNHPIPRPIA